MGSEPQGEERTWARWVGAGGTPVPLARNLGFGLRPVRHSRLAGGGEVVAPIYLHSRVDTVAVSSRTVDCHSRNGGVMRRARPALVICVCSALGCASSIGYTRAEKCALRDMKVTGAYFGGGSASASSYNWKTGETTSAHGRHSFEGVNCAVPETPSEKCDVATNRASATAKADYQDGYGGKVILNGIGYVLYIVPGILLKLHYDSTREDALAQAKRDSERAASRCNRKASETAALSAAPATTATTPEVETPTDGARVGPVPPNSIAAPTGAVGYRLGATFDEASTTCAAAGFALERVPSGAFRCGGTAAEFQLPAVVLLRFCGDSLCQIDVCVPGGDTFNEWVGTYQAIAGILTDRYGQPKSRTRRLVPECGERYLECFANGTAAFSLRWAWSDGTTILLQNGRSDGFVHANYYTAEGASPPAVPPPEAETTHGL